MKETPTRTDVMVRALIRVDGDLIVCHVKGSEWCFLPGGRLEPGESAEDALGRELKEELGATLRESVFIGATEHVFEDQVQAHHEIALIFDVVADYPSLTSREPHIEFSRIPEASLANERLLPHCIKEGVLSWLDSGVAFWSKM